jgi:tetratricopeptide (TPR) repeat protein
MFNIFNKNTRFFTTDEFNDGYSKEILSAITVYERMTESGFKDNALASFDFDFISDKKEKLESLAGFLKETYGFELKVPQKEGKIWMLKGDGLELPYTEDNLIFWAIDLYYKGYEYDCKLSGYGALTDPNDLKFLSLANEDAEAFHDKGLAALNEGNFGLAIIYFSVAIEMKPEKVDSWHARGYCKDELLAWKRARKDYDRALEIDPSYVESLLLRATNKDEAGEYDAALEDYNKAIELEPDNSTGFFNRGNTKFNLGNKNGACEDWKKARLLGSPYAQERIDMECK